MAEIRKQLILNKGGERFIFRYTPGCEDKLLETFADEAQRRRTSFDWFDAAILSYKLTGSLIGQAEAILHETADEKIETK